MILEFKIKNFRSILNEQTFSLIASHGQELPHNMFNLHNDKLNVLLASALYGPNASGKSNILSALLCMRYFILFCAKGFQLGEPLPADSFFFNEKSREQPSEFEVIFIKDGVRYQYGFVMDKSRIYEEWLFAYPLGRGQRWFSRVYQKDSDKYSWKFSSLFKHSKHLADLTREDVLFLSNAVKLNNEQLNPVFTWFQKDLSFIDSANTFGLNAKHSIDYIKTEKGKAYILQFMRIADPSIIDIKLEMEKRIEENIPSFPDTMPKEVQEYIKKEMVKHGDSPKIKFIHTSNISLRFEDESDGTRRLFAFAGHWIDALENGRVLIVDELENSLHPLLVKFLIQLIFDSEVNKKQAQLIFTTHNTSLLNLELFRRDQIWFVEKDSSNATQLYQLLDFSPRTNEAIERGYLQGRYGALPYTGEWRF